MFLCDSHTHLEDERYDEDREEVIVRAREEGVKYIINVGSDFGTSEKSVALAEKYPEIYAAAGVHPHEAKNWSSSLAGQIAELAGHVRVIAIGEIGLDFYWNNSPKKLQEKALEEQLNIAESLNLPVILHCRNAYPRMYQIVKSNLPDRTGIIHCFSSGWEWARKFLDLGFLLGIGGSITFKRNSELVDVVKKMPVEAIITETDCPYLTPVPFRGKRNEPAYVKYVTDRITEIKQVPQEELCGCIIQNCENLIKK